MIEVQANLFLQPEHVSAAWSDPDAPGEFWVTTAGGEKHRVTEPRMSLLEFVLRVDYALGLFPDKGCRS